MKLVIASDIHGSAAYARQLMSVIERESPDQVALLGDLLYHGPRNDLPAGYAPKEVAALLNGIADCVVAVRGNCDAEVDQMMLDFPCTADYAQIVDGAGRMLFLTHGHIWGAGFHNSVDRVPALPAGSALLFGHTHVKVNEEAAAHPGIWAFNPGSTSIPKDGSHSCGVYESGAPIAEAFRHVLLDDLA